MKALRDILLVPVLLTACLSGPAGAQGGWDPADSDSDGLPDQWETHYFGDLASNGSMDNDNDGLPNSLEFSSGRDPTSPETVAGTPDWQSVPGALRYEIWNGIAGTTLAELYSSPVFQQPAPSSAGFYTKAEAPQNQGDNFGLRMRGTLIAPLSGQYRFYIASDEQGVFFLGTSASRYSKQPICRVDAPTAYHNWTASATQASVLITLVAGHEYYIEALMKEGTGSDHLSLGWIQPGQTAIEVIPGRLPDSAGTVVLKSLAPDLTDSDDDGLPDLWETAQNLDPNSRTDHALLDSDDDGFNNLAEYQTGGLALGRGGNTGYCEWDMFLIGPNNGQISALTNSDAFAQPPAASGYFTAPEADRNAGNNFGRRIRGVITIPTTGSYRFYIAGDDASVLLINPNGVSRFGKNQVAFSQYATTYRVFTSNLTQRSQIFNFTAGHQIYFEALYVDGTGADHCSVGWTAPGVTTPVVIPSDRISVCKDETLVVNGVLVNNDEDGDSLPDDWERANSLTVTNSGSIAHLHGEAGDADNDGYNNYQEYRNGTHPLVAAGVPGMWTHEWYGNIGGSRVIDMIGSAGLLRAPDLLRLSDSTEVFHDYADNYGQRFRATIKAPADGSYTFWISGDNGVELWLSTDERKFSKRRLAFMDDMTSGFTESGFRIWDKNPGQKSAPVILEKDKSYYIEVLHKEAEGGDHVSLAWSYNLSDQTINWAQARNGATATQSSTSSNGAASRAIDGNTNGLFSSGASVSQTGNQQNSWLMVDFGTNRPVNRVVVYNRSDAGYESRLSNFRLSLLDAAGNEISGAGQNFFQGTGYAPPVLVWDLSAPVTARKVRIQLLGNNNAGNGYLNIAELEACEAPADSSPRVLLPASVLTSFVRDADDKDDDCLLDFWERDFGLSDTDNGCVNPDSGENGDPDADGLINRDEWLLGTDPNNPDTDGDGYPDGQEVFFMGTNPLVPELINPVLAGEVAGEGHAAASATWVPTADGGVFSMETRGWIDYEFTVSSTGYYIFEIRGRARGSAIQSREDFPLDVYIDSMKAATTFLTSLNGQPGLAAGFAGRLTEGSHRLRIWNRNLLARRALQIDSLKILRPSGADSGSNGMPDWIFDFLTARNSVTTNGLGSLTSPCCLEGTTREWQGTSVSVNSSDFMAVAKGSNNHWFTNVPLSSTASTPVVISFENGLLDQAMEMVWLPFNIAANSQLIIRKNDRLRLTAHVPGASPDSSSVSITLNNQALATCPADQPFEYEFANAGTYNLRANYGPNGEESCASTIVVLAADFGPAFPIYLNHTRYWSVPGVAAALPIENDKSLLLAPQTVTGTGRAFNVDATALGTNTVLVRTGSTGPVLATGEVTGTLLSRSGNNETQVIYTYPNGDRIVELTVMASDLPPGGYIRLEIWLGGRLFVDGTTGATGITKLLHASDFDENGMARVSILLSSGIGTTCHRTYLHDAAGNIIGQM